MNESLKWLKKEYENTEIPKDLDERMRRAMKKSKSVRIFRRGASIAAGLLIGFAAALNTIPSFALAAQEVPVLGNLAKVMTFVTVDVKNEEQEYEVKVSIPEIQGLENKDLQSGLNEKYAKEAKEMYDAFMAEIGQLEAGQLAHKALDAGYTIKVNNGKLLTIENYKLEIGASGAESLKYDTIDLERQILLTLPMLFKEGADYVGVLSEIILKQMQDEMAKEEGKIYFIAEDDMDPFTQIKPDQNFYINEDGKLVISFNEYEVAPGMMGTPSFVIPTEAIRDILVSDVYVK